VIYLVRMRPKFRAAAVALVLVGALSASGCAPEAPAADPTPTPSATPLFASDEEALAAAEEAYAAYQQVEDQILADGGQNGDRIRPFAVRDALQAAVDGFASFEEEGLRSIGPTGYELLRVQTVAPRSSQTKNAVTAYVCLDFSQSDVVNQNNESVVREGRPLLQEFEVAFDVDAKSGDLVLSSRDPWMGQDECGV